ncbi:MAG: sarcosine oxidase subunit delta [Rhizobiales bacterium]|nr:sarcosine oxidase subunit delta [Hyphomicrobiales bacterium]
MLIDCPHCGPRSNEEFTAKGDATAKLPAGDAGPEAHYRHVFVRDNPRGRHEEFWHHTGGCRCWLVVTRDTVTHEIFEVTTASEHLERQASGGKK